MPAPQAPESGLRSSQNEVGAEWRGVCFTCGAGAAAAGGRVDELEVSVLATVPFPKLVSPMRT